MSKTALNCGWLSKLMAATFLGTILVIGFMGVIGRLGHSDGKPSDLLNQYLIWGGVLLWIASFSTCFLWRSAKKTWFFYALFNVIIWSLFMGIGIFFP